MKQEQREIFRVGKMRVGKMRVGKMGQITAEIGVGKIGVNK